MKKFEGTGLGASGGHSSLLEKDQNGKKQESKAFPSVEVAPSSAVVHKDHWECSQPS